MLIAILHRGQRHPPDLLRDGDPGPPDGLRCLRMFMDCRARTKSKGGPRGDRYPGSSRNGAFGEAADPFGRSFTCSGTSAHCGGACAGTERDPYESTGRPRANPAAGAKPDLPFGRLRLDEATAWLVDDDSTAGTPGQFIALKLLQPGCVARRGAVSGGSKPADGLIGAPNLRDTGLANRGWEKKRAPLSGGRGRPCTWTTDSCGKGCHGSP